MFSKIYNIFISIRIMLTATYLLKALHLDYNVKKARLSSEPKDNPISNPNGWTTEKPSDLENVITYSTFNFNEATGGFDKTVHYHK